MPKPDPHEPATKDDLAPLVTKEHLKAELAELKADIAFRMYGALLGQMAITLAAVYFIVLHS